MAVHSSKTVIYAALIGNMLIAISDTLPATAIEVAVSSIERHIKAAHPQVSRVFVEAQSLLAHKKAVISASADFSPST